MKPVLIPLLLIVIAASSTMIAQASNPPLSDTRQEEIRVNILAGLEHRSMEVQADYVQLIVDLKRAYPTYDFEYAIIPLMDKLKNESDPGIRILAALALYEYKDSRKAKFAIQQTAKYDNSERVARHCQTLIRRWDNRTEHPTYTAHLVYPF